LDFDNSGCTESNPLQQGWFVPHDEAGLIGLLGGNERFCERLNEFFEKTPADFLWNPYCNHSNEPVHQCAYQFAYAGKPWLTQKWARYIATHAYGVGTMGIIGNEDVGQMSAWYVMSALGFYPACPTDGVYIIGSPIFPKVTLRLDQRYYKGKAFTVVAKDTSDENVYIQSAKLNGKPLDRAWITHQEVVSGGTLEFVMGPQPNKGWGNAALPPSLSTSRRL
jgi:predicted alpha-1,2-mannosidase